MHRHLRPLALLPALALPALGLAACSGSGSDAAATTAPSAVAYADQPGGTSTTAATRSAADQAATTLPPMGSTTVPGLEMTADMLTRMLASDQGRQLVVAGMASRAGITVDQATCFIAHVNVNTLVAFSHLQGADPAAALSTIPTEAMDDLQQALTTCNIPPSSLLPH